MPSKLSPSRTGRRVLVVDDDPAILELTSSLLTEAGCAVETAQDGYDALEKLAEFRPEALVLDLSMPAMDGFTVLKEMQGMGKIGNVKTLVFTARTKSDDVNRAVSLGARDYLSKPFEPQQLLLRVARLLIRRSALR